MGEFCDANCSKERIKGYMMAPWTRTFDMYEAKALEAAALMGAAIKARRTGGEAQKTILPHGMKTETENENE